MKAIFEKLVRFEDLTDAEMRSVIEDILVGKVPESQITAFLIALKMKGETADELAALARVIQEHALHVPTDIDDAMCNCGTGGDQSFSFNVSTTASFVLAAGGVHVAKHGNRSISSKSGSADVLEALGINVSASPETLAKALDQVGLAFLFAQTMHPAMRYISPARKVLGIPTIMNLVGPLTNPVTLKTQLMGTSRPDLLEQTAEVLKKLGRQRAIVITGPNGMDEAALSGTNRYALLDKGQITLHEFRAEDLGMQTFENAAIRGGDAKKNAAILLSVLKNETSPYLETTVLNAGLGFYANGKTDSLSEGINLARQVIADGSAYQKLQALQEVQI